MKLSVALVCAMVILGVQGEVMREPVKAVKLPIDEMVHPVEVKGDARSLHMEQTPAQDRGGKKGGESEPPPHPHGWGPIAVAQPIYMSAHSTYPIPYSAPSYGGGSYGGGSYGGGSYGGGSYGGGSYDGGSYGGGWGGYGGGGYGRR